MRVPNPATANDAAGPTRILAATTNVPEIGALRHVLTPMGVEPHFCTDAGDVLRLCQELTPAVILLDADLGRLDLARTTRILCRNPVTAAAAVLVVAPAEAGDRYLRRLDALELYAVLARPLTCEALRETIAAGLRFHADALALRRPPRTKPAATLAPGCNSLLARTLHCPFHPHGVAVQTYALRAGKVYGRTDLFDVPIYAQAAPGADFVDYNRAALCVCPECFFSTTEPRFLVDPHRPGGDDEPYFRADPATTARLAAGAGHRELRFHDALGEPAATTMFDHRRTRAEALLGYELAVESGRALVEAAPNRRAAENARVGGYELRRAVLYDAADAADRAAAAGCRRAAVRWLDAAFAAARGPALYLAAYQLVALCVHLGDDAAALQYLSAMKDMSGLGRRDLDQPAVLDRHLRRAQQVWARRDEHRAAA